MRPSPSSRSSPPKLSPIIGLFIAAGVMAVVLDVAGVSHEMMTAGWPEVATLALWLLSIFVVMVLAMLAVELIRDAGEPWR